MIKRFFKIVIVVLFITACNRKNPQKINDDIASISSIDWSKGQQYYISQISEALSLLDTLENVGFLKKKTKSTFFMVRTAFKKGEPYAGYLSPETAHKANGPALPIYKEDSGKVIKPVGFQKLEETIYDDTANQDDFYREITTLKGLLKNLKSRVEQRPLTAKRFFIATHQQLMRLTSLSTVGFDTPVSGKSIKEITASLHSLDDVYSLTIKNSIKSKDASLDALFVDNIRKATTFVDANTNFVQFDRYTFIRDYLNPIVRNWVSIRKASNLWDGKTRAHIYNFDAPTFFEKDSFQVDYFLDLNDNNASKEKIELGEKLFFDKDLSATGNVSCATCHVPEKAYTDGLKISIGNQGSRLKRNSPTLLNSLFQKNFFWDGRAGTIQSQINSVFNNKEEFATSVHRFSENIIEKDTSYVGLYKKAYGKIPTSNRETIRAISVYLSTLQSFDSKFDRNIRGEEDTYTASEKDGFNLFAGKALCATCHFIPLTNGTVPPFFTETEREVIGVPETKANKKWDNDLGYYWVFEEELHRGMFKTPSIRNVALTAPYMHNGIYDSLEEVIDFYNKGGGAGLGFDIPHQTLPFDNLNLSPQEIKDLVAFMKTLTDNNFSRN